MSETTPPKEQHAHARIPAPILWVQDHLLLALLMVGSGVINARFLVYGLVPDINDPSTWGFINTVEIVALACAGLALGGLEVRISYKLGECIAKNAWGRALFLMLGISVLAFIEFWASYSQRSQNIPVTAADHSFLTLLNLTNSGLNITAICISVAIPFLSVFWGFAAEDPAPEVVEDAETVRARMENELLKAQFNAQIRAAQAKGLRAGVMGALGREPVQESPASVTENTTEVTAFAESAVQEIPNDDGRITAEPPPISGLSQKGNWWDAQAYKDFVAFRYGIAIPLRRAVEIVDEVGNKTRIQRVGVPGKPSAFARVAALKKRASRDYGADEIPAVAGGFAEQVAE